MGVKMDWHDFIVKMDWPELLANLVISALVALGTASLIVHLALRHFYAEKWWERKSAAYFSIIESLHEVRARTETKYSFSQQSRAPSKTIEQELNQKISHAISHLRRQIDLGSLIISGEAISATHKLMAGLDASAKTNSLPDHVKIKLTALDECLSNMRRIAREDLIRP